MKLSIIFSSILIGSIIAISGCKKLDNLETKPFGKIPYDDYYNDPNVINNAQNLVTPALVPLGNSEAIRMGNASGYEQLDRTDRWGGDAGAPKYLEYSYEHNFKSDMLPINGMWKTFSGGIGTANAIIAQLSSIKGDPSRFKKAIAEIKALRAYFFLNALDNFGNFPLDTMFKADPASIKTNSRLEVFKFVEKELKNSIPLLDTKIGPNNRMNKYVAFTALAQLYLNAQVYTAPTVGTQGTARWADCMAACDSVIKSGRFSLTRNYFDNFAWNNNNFLNENILVSIKDELQQQGNTFILENLHQYSGPTVGVKGNPWMGFTGTAEAYNVYDSTDLRRRMWLVGPQRVSRGERAIDGIPNSGPLITQKVRGKIVPFDITITSDSWGLNAAIYTTKPQEVQKFMGPRNCKYYPKQATNQTDTLNIENVDMGNDYALMRYADVLLMRVECDMRINNNISSSMSYWNDVRGRAYGYTGNYMIGSPSLADIRNERTREFMFEGYSRRDNIRFQVADNSINYWSQARPPLKPNADPDFHSMLYPIPDLQRGLNPRLVQNPGY
jgi:hypothetical protein